MIELDGPSLHGEYSFTVRNSVTGEIKQELTCKNRINPKVYEMFLFGASGHRTLKPDYCFIGLDRIDENNDDEFILFTPETWTEGHTFEEARWRESNNATSYGFVTNTNVVPGKKLEVIYERSWIFPKGYAGVIKSVAMGDFLNGNTSTVVDYNTGAKYVLPTPGAMSTGRSNIRQPLLTFLSKTNITDNNNTPITITMDEIDELTVNYRVIYDFNTFAPDKQITIQIDDKTINGTVRKVKPGSNYAGLKDMPIYYGDSLAPFTNFLTQYGNIVTETAYADKYRSDSTLYTWNDDKTGLRAIRSGVLLALTFVDRPDPVNEPFKFRAKITYGVDDGNGRIDAIRLKFGFDDIYIYLDEPINKTNEMELTITFLLDAGGVNNVT